MVDGRVGQQLKPGIPEKIVNCLVELVDPVKILIFGSYASGAANENSDLDLLVLVSLQRNADRQQAVQCRVALRKILRGEGLAFDLLLESVPDFERAKRQLGTVEHAVEQCSVIIYHRY